MFAGGGVPAPVLATSVANRRLALCFARSADHLSAYSMFCLSLKERSQTYRAWLHSGGGIVRLGHYGFDRTRVMKSLQFLQIRCCPLLAVVAHILHVSAFLPSGSIPAKCRCR